MTILVTSDLHLSANSRDEYRHAFIGTLIELIKQHKIRKLVILGDLTDEKDRHSAELTNAIVGYLLELASLCEVFVLRGNHDCIDPNMPFFKFVGRLQNVLWINDPKSMAVDGSICLFLPHTRDHEKDWGILDARTPYVWIFAHNTFDGADAGGGRKLRGIPLSVFKRDVEVISGDVHVPQTLPPVTYVGAPYTINFGDEYQPRILLLEKGEKRSIKLNGPRKRLIEIPADIDEKKLNKLAKHVYEGDILKIKVHLNADAYSNWQQVNEKVRTWGEELGALVHSVVPVKASKTLKIQRSPIMGDPVDDPETLRKYAKRNNTPKDVLKMGLKLMEVK